MQEGEASKTALMVCACRALASARPEPLIHDPWAAALAGPEGYAYAAEFARVFADIELLIALRTAFLDRQVRRFVNGPQGVRQVVLLGAGFDARAARLAGVGARFFEVDFPPTQAEKRARIGRLPGYPIDAATYVPCDFERDDFFDTLCAHGLERAAPVLFLWECVTMYLSEGAVRGTLRRIASAAHPESIVIFDHLGKVVTSGKSEREQDRVVNENLSDLGEPLTFGTNHPIPLLYEEGFRYAEHITMDEECLALTGTYARDRMFRFQYLCVASARVPRDFVR